MDLGKKIKQLRVNKGITQEKLADYLKVSFQAVSKWEQGQTSPDISLLPKISTFFGISIDDLFTLSDDAHLERIENMLETQKDLNMQDELYAKNYLISLLDHSDKKGKAYTLLADLYNHRAESYHNQAIEYAKKALEINPELKENHGALGSASNVASLDWNFENHHKLIDYYIAFCDKHPELRISYMCLIELLIADGRLIEAKKYLDLMKQVDNTFRITWFEGMIEKKAGNHKKAFEIFDKMVASDPTNWLVWSTRADEHTRVCNYDKAIEDNKKALELQPKPRYIDAHECMAHIYKIKGDYENAIKMYEGAITLLKEEWSITFGESVDRLKREIKQLEELMM
ncbi:helix-turn-helix domain-containing protein [Oceanirhabdus sp. W0125-5]|uniref:helix-turn-helix domain-containing protein n=1 Tax=Oceanirhabdus sp. W0125-5 TaxID=2999116 RepID=UPI0022F2BA43|nr:helix-turn-helix domain-containing protein [Oceanirhabdus sp. W0125-5]WBW97697.1 helix-turn-helix domain-containing protein [Oceanirhabdus sp. W0125-5]